VSPTTLRVEEHDDRVVVTLAQAILFESADKRARMEAFLGGGRS
jgi:hypothetical protein